MTQLESCAERVRSRLLHLGAKAFFHGLSTAGRMHPSSRPGAHNVEVFRDIPYMDTSDPFHRLDIYRPIGRGVMLPVVLYVHGGGFQLLSKDTHWMMGLLFARAGYVVCNISYRLAPKHPFPAAIADTCAAFDWVTRRVREYGGDPERIIVAGESAGANLACALTLATCYRRPEPYARVAWDTGIVPSAVVMGCGILQVSDPERFTRRRALPSWVARTIQDVSTGYIRGVAGATELADPLVILEQARSPDRPLPPFFAFVGTRDPVLDDTRRLATALEQLHVAHEVRYYPGELHAFHALTMRKAARDCWRDKFAFLERALGGAA